MLTPIQAYETKDYCKVYFVDKNNNVFKRIVFCKAKDLNEAIN